MIPYFGRHGAKQYLGGKFIGFAYKMWCLCNRLGYLIQCDPYQGACGTYDNELGVGASVVLDLVSELSPDVPFKIYGDRFFSFKLAEILKSKRIRYTGIVKSNRTEKAPLIDLKEMAKHPRGSFDFCLNPLNPTFPHLKALRPEIPSQKFSKKIIFFFFSFWDYESPAALKPTSKSV